eukprot:gene25426-11086_t
MCMIAIFSHTLVAFFHLSLWLDVWYDTLVATGVEESPAVRGSGPPIKLGASMQADGETKRVLLIP